MQTINQVLLEQMGFRTTTHDRCIYFKEHEGKVIMLLRQVDDFLVACDDEDIAKNITNIIGTKIQLASEKTQGQLPIKFLD